MPRGARIGRGLDDERYGDLRGELRRAPWDGDAVPVFLPLVLDRRGGGGIALAFGGDAADNG